MIEKKLCQDPCATRRVILKELLNLNETASVKEILQANPRLPLLAQRQLSEFKIKSIKVTYI